MKKIIPVKTNNVLGYTIALAIGVFVGFRWSPQFVAFVYVLLALLCIYLAFQNDVKKLLSILPYLIYTEMFIRAYVLTMPYLFLQYLFITVFFIMILRGGTNVRLHSRNFIFLVLFITIELINSVRSTDMDITRALLINSLTVIVVVVWASLNMITPLMANNILNNVKYASVYLCGIVMARYLTGDVVFSNVSGSEGVNGLAPVQISGYLGFSCTIFFFSMMNEKEGRDLIINLISISLCAGIMLLSFSRGGLYFLGVMMLLYFIFNRKEVKSYFFLLLLIPVGFLVYNYVVEKTGGLIEARYEQEGTSGRQDLIIAAWKLFISDPLVGIGSGNFNTKIKKVGLYGVESGTHNEFMRVAAEDGILGIITYWGFFVFIFFEILGRSKIQREYAIYFLIFYCLISVHNGLKISLQPFLLMLAVATPTIKFIKRKYVADKSEYAV